MRVNLITQSAAASTPGKGAIPLSLIIKPACGLPGDYEYTTNSTALMQMLRQQHKLWDTLGARLLGVELSDRLLTDIGYFID